MFHLTEYIRIKTISCNTKGSDYVLLWSNFRSKFGWYLIIEQTNIGDKNYVYIEKPFNVGEFGFRPWKTDTNSGYAQ